MARGRERRRIPFERLPTPRVPHDDGVQHDVGRDASVPTTLTPASGTGNPR